MLCFSVLAFSKGLTFSGVAKSKGLGVAPGIPFKSGIAPSFEVDGKTVDLLSLFKSVESVVEASASGSGLSVIYDG